MKFAESVKRTENCKNFHSVAETVIEQVLEMYDILHTSSNLKKEKVIYPIPNQLNFKLINPKMNAEFERKKFFMGVTLEIIYS